MGRMEFIRLYREGKLEREDVSAQEIEALARQDDVVLWIDFTDPTADDLLGVETVYGLHRLAVEDAVHDFQRPKLDRYPNHLFLSAYEAHLKPLHHERGPGRDLHRHRAHGRQARRQRRDLGLHRPERPRNRPRARVRHRQADGTLGRRD